MSTEICLAASGLVVGWVTPWLLGWQARRGDAPRLTVLAWFVSVLAAIVLWLAAATHTILDHGRPAQLAGAVLGVSLVARVSWVVGRALLLSQRQQRDHLAVARIVGHRDVRPGVLVIDVPEPAVYCVRSGTGSVVMSRGAVELLNEAETTAVLVHEQTHLNERHHVLATMATALPAAFAWLGLFRGMSAQVALQLEMRADDTAVRACGRDTVIDALASLCLRNAPASALAAHGPTLLHRVTRLTEPTVWWRSRIGTAATFVIAVAVAATPLIGPWLPFCPHPLV